MTSVAPARSYVWDIGDFGAWNTGIIGNYILDRATFDGTRIIDDFQGEDSGGRINYRARLGWSGGPQGAFSVTLFMNWMAHYGNEESGDNVRAEVLPPSCFMLGNAPCNASGLPQFAQYTNQYPVLTNYEPARATLDLSLGYKTRDMPANVYLQNIGIQFVVTDLFNRWPNYAYQIAFAGGSRRAFDDRQNPAQRVITLIVTKSW